MPNWCYNQLTIKADKKTLDTIEKKHISKKLADTKTWSGEDWYHYRLEFQSILPLDTADADRRVCEEAGGDGYMAWSTWELRNKVWGTKWELSDHHYERTSKTEMYMDFDTAWSPPVGVIAELALLYPKATIELEFEESGCDFMGKMVWVKGEPIEDREWHYHPLERDDDFEGYELEFDERCPICQRERSEKEDEWSEIIES